MTDVLQVPPEAHGPDRVVESCKERDSTSIPMVSSDRTLPVDLDRVQAGDEDSLLRIIKEFSPLVYRVALGITGSEADAKDVLQEVFIGLPEALVSFDGGNFAGWLKVVASRRALMLLRAERRRETWKRAKAPVPQVGLEGQTLSRIMLEKALDQLDPSLRAVFLLKEVEGLTHAEIAEAMNISENLSQVRLYRARRTLRGILSP